jgi:hypothetical protein
LVHWKFSHWILFGFLDLDIGILRRGKKQQKDHDGEEA